MEFKKHQYLLVPFIFLIIVNCISIDYNFKEIIPKNISSVDFILKANNNLISIFNYLFYISGMNLFYWSFIFLLFVRKENRNQHINNIFLGFGLIFISSFFNGYFNLIIVLSVLILEMSSKYFMKKVNLFFNEGVFNVRKIKKEI